MTASWKAGIAFVIGAMWLVISVDMWPRVAQRRRLAANHATTTGEVVRVTPEDHNSVTYIYRVDGQTFTGSAVAGHLRVGENVRVYYSPPEPSLSMLSEPRRATQSDVLGMLIIYASVAVGAVVVGSFNYARARR